MGFDAAFEEGLRILGVSGALITIFTVCSYRQDSPILIYFYLAWCGYVAFWSYRCKKQLQKTRMKA